MLNKKPEQYSSQEAYTADVLRAVEILQELNKINNEIQKLEAEKTEIEKKVFELKGSKQN